MIDGFEDYTPRVKPEVLRRVLALLLNRPQGREGLISNRQIREELEMEAGERDEIQVRAAIHVIRLSGEAGPIVGNQRGYWRTSSRTEVAEYVRSLNQRMASIKAVRNALMRQAGLTGQGELF